MKEIKIFFIPADFVGEGMVELVSNNNNK